jgi:hypothetical protein
MVTTCPVVSVTDRLSTAIVVPTVETGVHPGCSVVEVVVGGTVVTVVDGADGGRAVSLETELDAHPASTTQVKVRTTVTR